MNAIKRVFAFCLFFQVIIYCSTGQNVSIYRQSDSLWYNKKKPLLAIGEVLVINMGVWAFDRYIADQDFAHVTPRSIQRNFKKGFVWDDDIIATNFISHPYHGSLYYNSARSNGFNFYQSIPFVVGGSLMWECFLETEPPSINDLIATTAGGTMFGEISYRISGLILNNSKRGANRVIREIGAGLICPVREVNRVFSGAAWRQSDYNQDDDIPFELNIWAGCRMLKRKIGSGYSPFGELAVSFVYNPNRDECEQPYDWFSVNMILDAGKRSCNFRQMNVSALLWGRDVGNRRAGNWHFGVYQNFDYWDSPVKIYQRTPYRYSQVLAIAPGINYKTIEDKCVKADFTTLINAIGLGASGTDYFWVGERDYSFGSGLGAQIKLSLDFFDSALRFKVMANNSTLYTWKGYDPNRNLYLEHPNELNTQGDKGHVNFTAVEASVGYYSDKNWNMQFVSEFINRYTYYAYHPSRQYSAWSYALRVGYHL